MKNYGALIVSAWRARINAARSRTNRQFLQEMATIADLAQTITNNPHAQLFAASILTAGAYALTEGLQQYGPWQNFFINLFAGKAGFAIQAGLSVMVGSGVCYAIFAG